MIVRPQYVYKFKSIKDETELDRCKDIIANNQIYIPDIDKLNDPLEAMNVTFVPRVAGAHYIRECGMIYPAMKDCLGKYRVLSLTVNIQSMVMWAYYGSDYEGYVLVYNTKGFLNKIQPVIYTDYNFILNEDQVRTTSELDIAVRESLLYKKTEWVYENEWRLIEEKPDGLQKFDRSELIGIVVGHKMKKENYEIIKDVCETYGIPLLKTRILRSQSKVIFVPISVSNDAYVTIDEIKQRMWDESFSEKDRKFFKIVNDIIL